MSKYFKPKTKKVKHVECGGFVVDFYTNERIPSENYAHISTVSRNFAMKVCGYPFGYMLESANQGITDNIHGFCAMQYLIADGIFQDQAFADELMKAVKSYQDRLMAKGAEQAAKVTPEQNEADTALLNDIISESNMSKEELAKKRAEDRELLKEVLNGEGEV